MTESIGEMIIPGTYIEVRAEGLIGVGGISTGNIGVVGTANRGPVGEAVILGSYAEALSTFGNYDPWPDSAATPRLTLTRALEQIFRMTHDLHRGRRPRQRERQVEHDGHRGADIHIAFELLESLRLDGDVIRIRRQVAEDVLPGRIGRGRPGKAGDWIGDSDLDRLHHTTSWIFHGALHGACATQSLTVRAPHADRERRDHGKTRDRENMNTPPRQHVTSLPERHIRQPSARYQLHPGDTTETQWPVGARWRMTVRNP
jgi:hypothetical protein